MNINERLKQLDFWEPKPFWNKEKSDHDNRLHVALDELESLRIDKANLVSLNADLRNTLRKLQEKYDELLRVHTKVVSEIGKK